MATMSNKMKFCDVGRHSVPALWKAKTKSSPSCCKACLHKLDTEAGKERKVAQKPRIKAVSVNRLDALKEYREKRDEFMKENSICQVDGCYSPATDLHHKCGRGVNLNNVDTWMATCRQCHSKIHDNDAWAREKGYLKSRLEK